MLQNAYLVAKIGVDTAENEPSRKSDVSWPELFSQKMTIWVYEVNRMLPYVGEEGGCGKKFTGHGIVGPTVQPRPGGSARRIATKIVKPKIFSPNTIVKSIIG